MQGEREREERERSLLILAWYSSCLRTRSRKRRGGKIPIMTSFVLDWEREAMDAVYAVDNCQLSLHLFLDYSIKQEHAHESGRHKQCHERTVCAQTP